MYKKKTEIKKQHMKNLIKQEILKSEVIVELRKGEFKANDKKKDLNNNHFTESKKDFLIIKSAFRNPKMKNFVRKLSYFRHKFIPEQERFDFIKKKKDIKSFFKNEKISISEISNIKCDFITDNNTFTFDLTKKKFFIKKDGQDKKNTNIMYNKNQFRLVVAEKEENIIEKKFNIFNLKDVRFLRIKFKNDFFLDFMNFNFFNIFTCDKNSSFKIKTVFEFCKKILEKNNFEEKEIYEDFKKILNQIKLDCSYQIECQLNYDFLYNNLDFFENIIDTFFYNFFQLYEEFGNYELLNLGEDDYENEEEDYYGNEKEDYYGNEEGNYYENEDENYSYIKKGLKDLTFN